jgi:DNA-binding transcriptional LysR family regulator
MSNWRPDLISLRVFVSVCDEASIARAAEREILVASAISKRIAEMEEAMGVELLIRGGRGVKPTEAGKTLLHHARHILRSTEKLQAEMLDHTQGLRGHVRLIANISAVAQFLPKDLSAFLKQHTEVRVGVDEAVSSDVVHAVKEGAADMGICLDSTDLAELHLIPYASDRLMLVTHASHPLARQEHAQFEQVLDFPLVGLKAGSRMTSLLTGAAARMGRSLNYHMHVGTFEVAAHIISEDLAIGVIPEGAIRIHEQRLALCVIPLTDDWARRRMVLCMRDYHALSSPARSLADHLHAAGRSRGESATVMR